MVFSGRSGRAAKEERVLFVNVSAGADLENVDHFAAFGQLSDAEDHPQRSHPHAPQIFPLAPHGFHMGMLSGTDQGAQ